MTELLANILICVAGTGTTPNSWKIGGGVGGDSGAYVCGR
jgi:hypothetical protein